MGLEEGTLSHLIACLVGEGEPALGQNTEKFSFLFQGPFSSRPLCGTFTSFAFHELSLLRKAFRGSGGSGHYEK